MSDVLHLFKQALDMVLHLDKHLSSLLGHFGSSTYFIFFAIVFCETGLVITPFLPGDSLLFASGSLAAIAPDKLNAHLVMLVFLAAALLGDSTNYVIGRWFGHRLSQSRFVRKDYLARAHMFYEKHGGKMVFFARFMPILRTFAPFVAGISEMPYRRFLMFSLAGSLVWVPAFVYAGYFFGNIPAVKRNFTYIIFAIIIISFLPAAIEGFKAWREGRKAKTEKPAV